MHTFFIKKEYLRHRDSIHSFKPSATKRSPYTETAIILEYHPYTKQKLGRNIMDEEEQNAENTEHANMSHVILKKGHFQYNACKQIRSLSSHPGEGRTEESQ